MANKAEDFRREIEQRAQRRRAAEIAQAELQNSQTREAERLANTGLLGRVCTLAHRVTADRTRRETLDAQFDAWLDKHKIFTESSLSPAHFIVATAFLLPVYAGALTIDIALLAGNTKLIVKDFSQGIQSLIYLAMVVVPLSVLSIETYFQTQWAIAETPRERWKWGITIAAMCLAIPAAIVGLSVGMAVFSGGAHTAQVQAWNLIGKAAFALFAHAAVLLGGRRLHEAKMYVLFKTKEKWLVRRASRLMRTIEHIQMTLTNTFTEYYRQLSSFNAEYAGHRIDPGPFDEITRNEINRAFGYEIIAVPPAPNPPAANDGNNTPNNGGNAANNPSVEPPNQNRNNQPNDFGFNMDGEDEVRP